MLRLTESGTFNWFAAYKVRENRRGSGIMPAVGALYCFDAALPDERVPEASIRSGAEQFEPPAVSEWFADVLCVENGDPS